VIEFDEFVEESRARCVIVRAVFGPVVPCGKAIYSQKKVDVAGVIGVAECLGWKFSEVVHGVIDEMVAKKETISNRFNFLI
jgi:hypothetical protein